MTICVTYRLCFCFQYIFLLLLIFLMEAMVGLLSYIYEEQVETDLQLNLNETFMTNYMVDQDKTAAIDFLQERVSSIYSHCLKCHHFCVLIRIIFILQIILFSGFAVREQLGLPLIDIFVNGFSNTMICVMFNPHLPSKSVEWTIMVFFYSNPVRVIVVAQPNAMYFCYHMWHNLANFHGQESFSSSAH